MPRRAFGSPRVKARQSPMEPDQRSHASFHCRLHACRDGDHARARVHLPIHAASRVHAHDALLRDGDDAHDATIRDCDDVPLQHGHDALAPSRAQLGHDTATAVESVYRHHVRPMQVEVKLTRPQSASLTANALMRFIAQLRER